MDNCQAIWNARYEKTRQQRKTHEGEPWLLEWLHMVPHSKSKRALDVGCGSGFNAKLLLESGFEVHAMDFSERALELCKRDAPQAHRILADIRAGLPFASDTFVLVVADLSLHYFSMAITAMAIRDIADKLVIGGLFAGRFNSSNDVHYGAKDGIAANEDGNLFLVGGIQKRFFTRSCFNTLIGQQWRIVSLAEKSTHRYGAQKFFWEIICAKCS
jgi:SAM-dependent methyltransferase